MSVMKKTNPAPAPASVPPPKAGGGERLRQAISAEAAVASGWVKETLLELKVRNALLREISPAEALRIHIAIEGQTVILTGAVEKPAIVAIAETLALRVEGVRAVTNHLTNAPASTRNGAAPAAGANGGARINDALLETKVMSKLLAKTGLGALKLEVEAEHGVINLSGTVADLTHRDEAVRIVRETGGVKSVIDRLKIVPFDDAVQ